MTEENVLPDVPELIHPVAESIAVYPFDVALVINNVVYQLMNVDGNFASQLLANPKFIQVLPGEARVGWTYDEATKKFLPPADLAGL